VEALVSALVVELARRSPRDGEPLSAPVPVRQAAVPQSVRYVDRHFREPLRLADVAAGAHLSPHYFSEQFRLYTGVTFQRYLQERRLSFAHALLAASTLSVTEVCHAAGFSSLSHFGRAYRRRYGAAPSVTRRERRSRDHDDAAPAGPTGVRIH
jgi:transcriptional regulator GlxA family with amidase domain